MRKIVLSLFVIIAMTTVQANAFDLMSALKFWDRATEQQTAEAQTAKTLAEVENQMAVIDKSVQDAFLNIVSELSARKEEKTIKSNLKVQTITDVINSYTNTIANNKNNFTDTIKNMSAKEKTTLVNNVAALSESGQQYLLLATDGIKAATNALKASQKLSEFATTVNNVNNVANQLKSRATTVINLANQIKTIATSAGVAVQ